MPDWLPRRKVEELITLYALEPNLRDIYVEGEFDVLFYSDVCRKSGRQRPAMIRCVDEVEVDASILRQLGLTDGSKQRVQALARLLFDALGQELNVRFIVDADLDAFGEHREWPNVLVTDYSTVEMYILNDQALARFSRALMHGQRPEDGMGTVVQEAAADLPNLLCLRLALRQLDLRIALLDLGRQLDPNGRLDIAEYIRRLSNRGAPGRADELGEVTAAWLNELTQLPARRKIHGKDFVQWLWSRIRSQCRLPRGTSEDTFLRTVAAYVEWPDVQEERLFQALVN